MAQVRARYENGSLTPLEPLELEEGAEVTVWVDGARVNSEEIVYKGLKGRAARRLAHRDMTESRRRAQAAVPPEEWAKWPADFSKNKKHYLYGHPKEVE